MVRTMAESALWAVWFRADSPENNQTLEEIRFLIGNHRLEPAIDLANRLIARARASPKPTTSGPSLSSFRASTPKVRKTASEFCGSTRITSVRSRDWRSARSSSIDRKRRFAPCGRRGSYNHTASRFDKASRRSRPRSSRKGRGEVEEKATLHCASTEGSVRPWTDGRRSEGR